MNQPKIAGSGAAVMALVVTFALGRSPPPFVAATPDPSAAAGSAFLVADGAGFRIVVGMKAWVAEFWTSSAERRSRTRQALAGEPI